MRTALIRVLLAALLVLLPAVLSLAEDASTDVVILSTTDMHGKCWETNILTDTPEPHNMLRVATAAAYFRETYGEGNVLLIDNGDLYQGTPISQMQLYARLLGSSDDPLAMSVCLKEIGYDAFVLGNHEFNFDWDLMRAEYDWLEENGIPVLAANACREDADGDAAEICAFTPYVIRTVTVSGHEHRIGILGLENCDITRWDIPANYPGIRFTHPGNDDRSMAREAELFLPRMRAEGCEFIIVAYHGGLGNDEELVFGANSENQAFRLIAETEGVAMLINGHDHSAGYSGTLLTDRAGEQVPVVNGGGQELTRTVFRFSEDDGGNLVWELLESGNVPLDGFAPDEDLREKIRPYAEYAAECIALPAGLAGGSWDEDAERCLRQTDTIDLIHATMLWAGTVQMQAKYGSAAAAQTGADHIDIDMSISSDTVSGSYVVTPGEISFRDIFRLYRFNNTVFVIPMTGAEIRAIMEENAAEHLKARVYGGSTHIFTRGDEFTTLLFGGVSFTCDLSKPEGERIGITGFHNGRPFRDDAVYLVMTTNYLLGNERCGLRRWSADDAVWSQAEDRNGTSIQDLVGEYLEAMTLAEGGVTPEDFGWYWEIVCGEAADETPPEDAAAVYAPRPEDGKRYVLYHEAEGCTLTARPDSGGLDDAPWEARGGALTSPRLADALVFTVHTDEDGTLTLETEDGLWLTSGLGGSLFLTDEPSDGDLSRWRTEPAADGWYLISCGNRGTFAVEYYSGRFTTYALSRNAIYLLNFYEVTGKP